MKKPISHGLPVLLGSLGGTLSRWMLLWLLARYAGGVSSVGSYAAILAFATPVFVAASLGLRTIYLSAQVRWPWKSYVLLRACGVFLGMSAILILLAVNTAIWSLYGPLLVVVVCMKVADAFLDLQLARAQVQLGLGRLGYLEIVNSLATIPLCTVAALLWATPGVIILASAVSSFGVAALAVLWNRRARDEHITASESGLGWILRTSVPVTASQVLASMLLQIPILVVAANGTLDQVGAFAVAAYFITLMNLFGGVLQTIAITPLRDYWSDSRQSFTFGLRRFLVAAILLGAAAWVATAMFGDAVVAWVYGETFTIGMVNFAVIGGAMFFVPLAFVLSAALNVLNSYSRVTYAVMWACGVAFGLGLAGTIVGTDPVFLACVILLTGASVRAVSMYKGQRRALSAASAA